MILNKLIASSRILLITAAKQHSTFIQSFDFNLGDQMKILNDDKQYTKSLELFDKHKDNSEKCSNWAIIQALKACSHIKDTQRGSNIHDLVSSRLKHDPYVLPALIHFYMQCGNVIQAECLFNTSSRKTVASYGAMMKGYIKNQLPKKAIHLFHEIKKPNDRILSLFFNGCAELATEEELHLIKCVLSKTPSDLLSNVFVITSAIDALMECGDVKTAQTLFQTATTKDIPMYASMMKGFTINHMPIKAIQLFDRVHDDFEKIHKYEKKFNLSSVDTIFYLCLIKALARVGMFSICESVMQRMPRFFYTDLRIQTALIDMWGKVGRINEAKQIFENISQPNHIAYTAMINSYGLNGMGIQAVKLFRQMPKEFIDGFTYVCILNACSHSGLVDTARTIFNDIQDKTERIFTTMIDCLSRAAAFEDAQQLIEQFECRHPPSCSIYMALLSGARNNNNIALSQKIFSRMKLLFPDSESNLTTASILLANVYASSGDMEMATDIRTQLDKSGSKVRSGVSITEIDGNIFEFRAHDRSHPRSSDIHNEANKISKELVENGHEYDPTWITRPMQPDETIESILCGHSERLAIAAHFIDNRKPNQIQITKNLRVCGDCHRATKVIAAMRRCEIIVRDANRIHHFYVTGQCSCQDYF